MGTKIPLARVLVIDDNSDIREMIRTVLVHAGYEVTLAVDGGKGVEAQRRHASDLTITDIFMPQQDGIETIGLLKKEFPKTPIIAMSGGAKFVTRQTSVDYLATAHKFGADRLLRKPFDIDELLTAVQEVLSKPAPT
jgi:CheY-like chemotaxis protein